MKRTKPDEGNTDVKKYFFKKGLKTHRDILQYTITGSIIEINFKWVVKELNPQLKHSSKELFAGEYNEIKFQLTLEPLDDGLALKVSTEFQRPCLAYMCEFSCVKTNLEETNTVSSLIRDSKRSDHIFKNFLKKNDLDNEDLLHNGSLIILCKINADLYRSKLTDLIWTNAEETWDSKTKATEAYESLLNSGNYHDITLVVQGKQYLVHRCVLCTRSSFFRRILEPHAVKKVASIELDDINPEMMNDVLKYIYSGKIGSYDYIKLHKLIRAAHKLELTELLRCCENRLCKEVRIENHKEILLLASQCDLKKLNETVIKYIAANINELREADFQALADIEPNSVINVLSEISRHYALVKI